MWKNLRWWWISYKRAQGYFRQSALENNSQRMVKTTSRVQNVHPQILMGDDQTIVNHYFCFLFSFFGFFLLSGGLVVFRYSSQSQFFFLSLLRLFLASLPLASDSSGFGRFLVFFGFSSLPFFSFFSFLVQYFFWFLRAVCVCVCPSGCGGDDVGGGNGSVGDGRGTSLNPHISKENKAC